MIEPKFDFDDILIEPCEISTIESRKQVNVLDDNNFLPLFTAPMDTVLNKDNYHLFIENNIYSVLPRNIDIPDLSFDKTNFISFSLNQFEKLFIIDKIKLDKKTYVLIDVANGNMQNLFDAIKQTKNIYGEMLCLMVGNIGNPKTYSLLSDAGADFVRCGIGNGSGCLTTEQSSIGYPMASLISEVYKLSCELKNPAKIIADGGFKKYADIIKGLALGADYIMLGGLFNKALESCGETIIENKKHNGWVEPGDVVDQYSDVTRTMFQNGTRLFKKFRGMSTKEVQKSLGNTNIKTSEGITKMNEVEFTISSWVENFKHYLSSAMSYTGKKNLYEFIGKVNYNMITENSFKRFNK